MKRTLTVDSPCTGTHLGMAGSRSTLPALRVAAAAVLTLLFAATAMASDATGPDSDAPEARGSRPQAATGPASYGEALTRWRTPEDLSAWIGDHFEYDPPRALLLSETQRQQAQARLPIHDPEAFFGAPHGICVDLARFGVETLRGIAPDSDPGYLMIEFDPVSRQGQVLRRHWVASFRRAGMLYFFADSKRPGHIAGPYAVVADYIAEYAAYRRRPIVAFKELPSYQRQTQARAGKQFRNGD
jgi:hypothetical protein